MPATTQSGTSALAGLKILDLSRFLPAAYCTTILGDYGADVIRIEQPREVAKQNRVFGREHLDEDALRECREREMLARNKRSVTLNLRDPGALAALRRMLQSADVLIHDYRHENAVAMGLDYAALQTDCPQLIHAEVSVCGQSGPYQSLAGHDPVALALSGALSRLGGEQADYHIPGMPVGDLSTGLQAVIGILVALRARDLTGKGQSVDIAMSDCGLSLMTSVFQRFLMDQHPPPRAWKGANIGLWKTRDGKTLCTTDLEPAYWEKFCQAVNRPDLIPLQFDQAQADYRNSELEKLFLTRNRDQWFELLRQAGTQVAPAYDLDEALADEHARARGTVTEVPNGKGEVRTQVGPAVKLSDTPGSIRSLGHLPGDDNQTVLREFGFTEREINSLNPSRV